MGKWVVAEVVGGTDFAVRGKEVLASERALAAFGEGLRSEPVAGGSHRLFLGSSNCVDPKRSGVVWRGRPHGPIASLERLALILGNLPKAPVCAVPGLPASVLLVPAGVRRKLEKAGCEGLRFVDPKEFRWPAGEATLARVDSAALARACARGEAAAAAFEGDDTDDPDTAADDAWWAVGAPAFEDEGPDAETLAAAADAFREAYRAASRS